MAQGHLDHLLSREIKLHYGNLPISPISGYTDLREATTVHAFNITVVHISKFNSEARVTTIPPLAPTFLVRRVLPRRGIGPWNGVTGRIEVVQDPNKDPDLRVSNLAFDPMRYAITARLENQCGFTGATVSAMSFYLAERITAQRRGKTMHVHPVLAVYGGGRAADARPNPKQLAAHRWVPLGKVTGVRGIDDGYVNHILPRARRAMTR